MRHHFSILLALLAAAPPAAAQVQAAHPGWYLGGGVAAVRFGHVAVSQAAPGVAAEVRPTARPSFHLSLGRELGSWALQLEAGWAGGHIEAGNDVVTVQDLSAAVSRYRLAVGIERHIAGVGAGTLRLGLAPTLDVWMVDGTGRVRAGAEGRLVLGVPLGAVELENRLGVGISGNPIEMSDIGEVSDLRGLRAVFVGIGLRLRT